MNCDLAREHALDGGGPPGPSVDRHLESCDSCREFVRELTPLRERLAAAVEAPPDRVWERLKPTVTAHARTAESRVVPWWRGMGRRVLATAAAAAAVVAMAWHGLSGAPPPPPQASPPAVTLSTPAMSATESQVARVEPAPPTMLAGPGREDTDLRGVRAEIDWLQRDMQRF